MLLHMVKLLNQSDISLNSVGVVTK